MYEYEMRQSNLLMAGLYFMLEVLPSRLRGGGDPSFPL
jgi:hypothetical protein